MKKPDVISYLAKFMRQLGASLIQWTAAFVTVWISLNTFMARLVGESHWNDRVTFTLATTGAAIAGFARTGPTTLLRQLVNYVFRPNTRQTRRQRPPLGLLRVLVKGLWSAKTYERVFKPVIADIDHEWRDARRRHEKFRAWWIKNVRGRYAVLDVARQQLPWSIWSMLKKLVRLMLTFSK